MGGCRYCHLLTFCFLVFLLLLLLRLLNKVRVHVPSSKRISNPQVTKTKYELILLHCVCLWVIIHKVSRIFFNGCFVDLCRFISNKNIELNVFLAIFLIKRQAYHAWVAAGCRCSWNTGHRRPWYIARFHNNLCYLKCNSGVV